MQGFSFAAAMRSGSKIFFQALAAVIDARGGSLSHISVMPRFIIYTRDLRFILGIALDKSIFNYSILKTH